MEISKLTIGEVEQIQSYFAPQGQTAESEVHPYNIGKPYFIRTVTNYYTGRIVKVTAQELVLEEAAWIADTGRFADAMKDFNKLSEIEPFPCGEVVIGRGAILDAHQTSCDLPREQK